MDVVRSSQKRLSQQFSSSKVNFWRVNAGCAGVGKESMGITGLLPFLKEAQRAVNVNSFRGKKVAVDAYCWLHKGSYSCAMQLVMKSEKLENL